MNIPLLALIFSLASVSAAASTTLTIGEAVRIALEKNPGAQSAREHIHELDESLGAARGQIFPSIGFTLNSFSKKDPANLQPLSSFYGNPYDNYVMNFQVTQPIFPGMFPWDALKAAQASRRIAVTQKDMTERDLTVNVIESFYTILLNKETLETVTRNRKVLEHMVDWTHRRFKIGRSQKLDLLQAQTQLALIDPQIEQADNHIKIAATQLATYLGYQVAGEVVVKGRLLPIDPSKVDFSAEEAKKLPQVYEVLQADQQIEQLDYQSAVTLAPTLPQLNAVGTWGRNAYVPGDLFNDYSTQWSLGLQLSFPLFSGLSSVYQRRALSSQESQLVINRTQAFDQAALNQVQAKKNLDYAKASLESSHSAYELGKESIDEAEKQYRLATIDYLQYLTSEQSFLTAELSYEQAEYNYVDSLVKYFVAWGYPLRDLVAWLEGR